MAEKRKKIASVCVKNGAKGSGTLEFFPASEWGGPEGLYRVRVSRRWINGTRREKLFMDYSQLAAMLAYTIWGVDLREKPRNDDAPHMPRCTRVSVPNGNGDARDVTMVSTEAPMRGADGRWYVGVYLLGRGVVMVPCEDCIIK